MCPKHISLKQEIIILKVKNPLVLL